MLVVVAVAMLVVVAVAMLVVVAVAMLVVVAVAMLAVVAVAMLAVVAVAMLAVAMMVVVAVVVWFSVFYSRMLYGFPIGLLRVVICLSNHRINLLLLLPLGHQASNRQRPILSGTICQ